VLVAVPFEAVLLVLLPPVVPEVEVDPEDEVVVPVTEELRLWLGTGTARVALMQVLSWLFWMVRGADWASAPVLSRRLKKTVTPSVTLTVHEKDDPFIGGKLTRAVGFCTPEGSTLKKKGPVPPTQPSKTGWH